MEIPESNSESGVPELLSELSCSLIFFCDPGSMYFKLENLKEDLLEEDLGKDIEDR